MNFKGYSSIVIDHFMEPRNNYEMADADGVGQAGDPSCGDAMGIYIQVRDGRIVRASYVVMGCVGAISSGSMTTVLAEGRTLAEACALTPQDIADALGGLPEHKIHCSVLGADALRNAVEDYRKKTEPQPEEAHETNEKRPNVLYIMCDQFRFDCIAALGNPIVRTPNLDRLAARGAAFTNAYSTCPVCVPARYTIRTGREPRNTGCYCNEVPVPMDGLAERMEDRCGEYLARRMGKLGYRTFGIGKFHAHPDRFEDLGYETQLVTEELWDTAQHREGDAYAAFMHREHPEYDHIRQLHGERTNMYYVPQMSPFPPELTVEGFVADRVVGELEKDDKRPYFGFVSFVGPHPPCAPPAPYHLLYDPDDMPNPVTGDLETDHMDEEIPWMNRLIWADELNDFAARNLRSRYLAEITYIDDCIGKILDAVEKRPDADNTLIAFFSDHGDGLGDHHMWQKENYFEQAARVPFLVSWPGRIASGKRDDLVCLTDLFGLATAAAGQEDVRDGVSLWNVLQGKPGRAHLFAVHGRPGTDHFKCMVRTGDWKYIFMSNGNREQLFHLKEDPMELVNRADEGCEVFRRIAEAECARAGLQAALEDGRMRTFPFKPWPRGRIRQFDVSNGDHEFITKRR